VKLRQNLAFAQTSSKSLLYVIDDLLNVTSDHDAFGPDFFDAFDLKAMIEDTLAPLHRFADSKGLAFKFLEHPYVCRHVRGDMHAIQRCLSNLVTNAISYTDQGMVTVEWNCPIMDDSQITRLSVTDTGRGLTEQELDELFQQMEHIAYDTNKLTQTENESDTPVIMGTGLTSVGISLLSLLICLCRC
jgi:signal transduction histidine kinase